MLSSLLLRKTTHVDSELDALFKSQPASDVTPITAKKRKREAPQDVSAQPAKSRKQRPQEQENDADNSESLHEKEVDEDNSDSDADPSTLVHESLTESSRSRSGRGSKQKYVPSDETPAQKDLRTIFVGNLPLQVAQKRPLQKQLQRHILSFSPSAKIESTRFRSVPFNTPTSNLSSASTTTTTPNTSTPKNPSQRSHDRTRASSWKTQESTDDSKPDEKQFLNPSQKKRIAFINHEFHTTADTVHAYIVFAYPIPQDLRPKNLPPLDPVTDPFVAAKEAVKKADGSVFMDRIIRVDSVGKTTRTGSIAATADGGEDVAHIGSFSDVDPKCTLFVGNLEFASEEGDLRVFFEGLMKTERGDPPPREIEETLTEKRPPTWVKRVRIIKDKETQLGKGFAYVQFIDRECVDTLLTYTPDQLKFAKRKLRINRCKTIQGSKVSSAVKSTLSQPSPSSPSKSQIHAKPETKSKKSLPRITKTPTEIIEIPKGDPALGTKLAHLSKEQRKQAKASDADRVARRLAKKKARMAMGTTGGSEDSKHRRERVRKRTTVAGGAAVTGKKRQDLGKKKGRVRSEKSLEKRNMKK